MPKKTTGTKYKPDRIQGQLNLWDWIRVMHESQIFCSKCDNDEYAQGEHEKGAKVFYTSGWRADSENIYCPSCANKNNIL